MPAENRPGENRTPDKIIGEVKHAEQQAERTTGHQPPHGPGADHEAGREADHNAGHEKEDIRAFPDRDPSRKKTGEF